MENDYNSIILIPSLSHLSMLVQFINNVIMNTTNDTTKREISCSENVVFISIFYDILILLTYWFGLILFSHNEKDSVFNLAEKVI